MTPGEQLRQIRDRWYRREIPTMGDRNGHNWVPAELLNEAVQEIEILHNLCLRQYQTVKKAKRTVKRSRRDTPAQGVTEQGVRQSVAPNVGQAATKAVGAEPIGEPSAGGRLTRTVSGVSSD